MAFSIRYQVIQESQFQEASAFFYKHFLTGQRGAGDRLPRLQREVQSVGRCDTERATEQPVCVRS